MALMDTFVLSNFKILTIFYKAGSGVFFKPKSVIKNSL